MDASELQRSLVDRASKLAEWFFATLDICEGRADRDIELLLQAVADDGSKQGLAADELFMLWDMFEEDVISLVDDPKLLESIVDLPLDPKLEIAEYALLIGLHLSRASITCFLSRSNKQCLLAAHLLASASEAQCYWIGNRGLTGCRNPHPKLVAAENTLKQRENTLLLRTEKSREAKRNAKLRHSADPKQKAKQFVRECWDAWQANPSQYRTQAEFARDMMEKVGVDAGGSLESIATITNKWIPEFRKGGGGA